MKRDGDNTETHAFTHTSCRPVHPTLFIGQFSPGNLGAELKWREKLKIVRQGEREGGEEGRKKETWGVIGGMVRDRCNFQTTAGK